MVYSIKYKRRFFYRTLKNIEGHQYINDHDKLLVFYKNGVINVENNNNAAFTNAVVAGARRFTTSYIVA